MKKKTAVWIRKPSKKKCEVCGKESFSEIRSPSDHPERITLCIECISKQYENVNEIVHKTIEATIQDTKVPVLRVDVIPMEIVKTEEEIITSLAEYIYIIARDEHDSINAVLNLHGNTLCAAYRLVRANTMQISIEAALSNTEIFSDVDAETDVPIQNLPVLEHPSVYVSDLEDPLPYRIYLEIGMGPKADLINMNRMSMNKNIVDRDMLLDTWAVCTLLGDESFPYALFPYYTNRMKSDEVSSWKLAAHQVIEQYVQEFTAKLAKALHENTKAQA